MYRGSDTLSWTLKAVGIGKEKGFQGRAFDVSKDRSLNPKFQILNLILSSLLNV